MQIAQSPTKHHYYGQRAATVDQLKQKLQSSHIKSIIK